MACKFTRRKVSFILIAAFVVLCVNCEVGLGNSVDTQPPSVSIVSPAKGAVIRNTFTMHGLATDETYIQDVSVLFTSTKDKSKSFGPYHATIDKEKETWRIIVNQKYRGGYEIPDGEYGVTVTAKDSASRTSVAESLYTVDNTPPVVVIKRPGLDDTFGQTIKITGDISDSSSLNALHFTPFKANADGSLEKIGETQTFKNISGVGLELTVGKYFSDTTAADYNASWAAVYDAVYDSSIGGTQDVMCVIEVEDSAEEYDVPEESRSVVATGVQYTGNHSTEYYLYDEIYSKVYSSSGYGLSNNDLVQIMNGSFSDAVVAAEVKEFLATQKIVSNAPTSERISSFSLNPSNSPTFAVSGWEVEGGYYSGLVNESKISVSVSPGRDQISLDTSSIRVFLRSVDAPVSEIVLVESEQNIAKETDETKKAALQAKRDAAEIEKGDAFRVTVSIGLLVAGKKYEIYATGCDLEGNEILASEGASFGFQVQTNNKPPSINIQSGTEDLSVLNKVAFEYAGTVEASSDTVYLAYEVSAKNEKTNESIGSVGPFDVAVSGSGSIRSWQITMDESDLAGIVPSEPGLYLYSVTICAENGDDGQTTEVNRRVHVDTATSSTAITSVVPQVTANGRDNNVNGTISVSGTVADNYILGDTVYHLYVGDSTEAIKSGSFGDVATFSFEIDTTAEGFTDKSELKIQIVSTDSAGNVSGATEQVVFIDQSTDLPGFVFSNVSPDSEAKDNLLGMGSWTMYGTVTDDDGLESVVYKLDGATTATTLYGSDALNGTTSKSFECKIDNKVVLAGEHTVEFIATDKNGKQKSSRIKFAVDNDAPVVGVSEPSGSFAPQSVTVKGTASDSGGVSGVAFVSIKKDGEEISLVSQPVPQTTDSWLNWTCDVSLSDADINDNSTYTQTYEVSDKYGRTTETSFSYKVDKNKPVLGNIFVAQGGNKVDLSAVSGDTMPWFTQSALTLSGTVEETNLDTITMSYSKSEDSSDTTKVVITPVASFNVTEDFGFEGSRQIQIIASDKAGNSSTKYVQLQIDTLAPVVSALVLSAADKVTAANNVTVEFSAEDATSGLSSYYIGTALGFAASDAIASGSLSAAGKTTLAVDVSTLYEGTHSLYLRVVDAAGNATSDTLLGAFTRDITPPAIVYTSPAANATVNKTISIAGTVSDVNMVDSAVPVVYVKATDGSWKTVGNASGSDIVISGLSNVSAVNGTWQMSGFDTTVFSASTYDTDATKNGVQLVVQVSFEDKAGNKFGLDDGAVLVVTADQNADRPVVKLSNVNTDGSTILRSKEISGTVTDDDGVSSLYIQVVKDGGSFSDDTWQALSMSDGNWSHALTGDDGSYTVFFKVVDTAGGVFTISDVASDSLVRPYLQYQSNARTEEKIVFGLDTTPPTVFELEVSTNGVDYDSVTNNMVFGGGTGGSSSMLYFRAEAGDTVTSAENLVVTLSNLGSVSTATMAYDSASQTYTTDNLDISSSPSGSYTITVTAKDESGMTGQFSRVVIIDNAAPNSVTNVVPVSSTEVTGEVSMSGFVADESNGNSGIASMRYVIPPYGTAEGSAQGLDWQEMTSFYTSSWSIKFTNLGDYVGDKASATLASSYSGYETDVNSGLYLLPVWFEVKDKAGNVGYITDAASIRYNPNADKPRVEVMYPIHDQEDNGFKYVIMGGTVRITGSAEDNEGIDSVWLQYDMDGDGTFEWTSADDVDAALYSSHFNLVPEQITAMTGQFGVKATGTVSWSTSLLVNGLTGLNYAEDDKTLNVRAVAVDSDTSTSSSQLVGAWSDTIHISVNNSVPQFGATDSLKLRRYDSNGNVIAEQEYSADMYIKGNDWFFTGSVEDDDGLRSISVTGSSSGDLDSDGWFIQNGGTTRYDMKIPVRLSGSGSGNWNVSITAEDNDSDSSKTATTSISINIDNTAPSFNDDGTLVLYRDAYGSSGTVLSEANPVQNSNGWFTLAGKVTEDGSGFERMVVYFKRGGTDGTRVYNVMEPYGIDRRANRTDITATSATSDAVYVNEDNLPVLYLSNVGRGGEANSDYLTSGSINGNANVRVGGLVKIGGVYRRISSVSGNEVKFSPACSTSFTEAEIVYGMVVDSTGESLGSNDTVKNDDGDGMVESYRKSGSDYTWDFSVNSQNIPDGPIEVHVVAFDVAGNSSHGYVVSNVSNNRPRITSVKLGTDLSGNGVFEDSEYDSFYVNLNANGTGNTSYGTEVWNLDTATWRSGASLWTVKDGLSVKPQFVGGTMPMYYSFSKSVSGDSLDAAEVGSVTEFSVEDGFTLDNAVLGGDGENGTNVYRFSFWDSTEETTPGTDSQWTVLNAVFRQDLTDDVPAKAVVSPFYWNNASDNSLYGNSMSNGHIEISEDLPDDMFTQGGSGVYDRDPKVSGKITVRGYFYDDVRLGSLWMQFPGFTPSNYDTAAGYGSAGVSGSYYQFAHYDVEDGWVPATATMENDGWEVTVSDSEDDGGYFGQAGHKVVFTLSLDTARIASVAAADVELQVMAVDHTTSSSNASAATADGTPGDDAGYNNPAYVMDVVPYISGVETPNRSASGLKNNNIRAASGKYSVIKGSTSGFITVKGFNLNPSAVRIVDSSSLDTAMESSGIAVSYTEVSSDYTSVSLSNDLSNSGYLEVFTNGVRTLNNINDNDAHDVTGEGSDIGNNVSDYANYYNREPDYYTTKNVLLTDDRYLRLFDMKNTGVQNGYYPTMIMNGDNPVFGYVNLSGGPSSAVGTAAGTGAGTYYASCAMPQRAEFNGTDASEVYTEYLIKASLWDQMGMAVDDDGRYYHVSLYNRDSCRFSFIYDRYAELHTAYGYGWGSTISFSGYDNDLAGATRFDSQSGNNAISLESCNYKDLLLGRYQYPKIVAKGGSVSGKASIYMTYYDACLGELTFRNFQIGTSVDGTATALYSGGTDQTDRAYSQYYNFTEAAYGASDTWDEGRLLVANGASKYFSMDVTSDNRVVIVYYDEGESRLKLSYSSEPVDGSNPTAEITWVESSIAFPDYIGNYVSMTIDENDAIHISAFDASDSDLVYIYVPSYNSTSYEKVAVDQAFSVGNWTQIKVHEGVPYIAYYNSSESGGRDAIKLAYANAAITSTSDVMEGVDLNGYTTGAWEYMTVPAITPPQGGSEKFQNVCLDFDSAGNPVVGYLGSYLEFGKWISE